MLDTMYLETITGVHLDIQSMFDVKKCQILDPEEKRTKHAFSDLFGNTQIDYDRQWKQLTQWTKVEQDS